MLYFYSIAGGKHFIISKLIFNVLLDGRDDTDQLVAVCGVFRQPGYKGMAVFGYTLLGGTSLSLVFTFLSAIAARAQQNAALMAIMGFPLIIPQLMLLMRISNIVFSDIIQVGLLNMIFLLAGLDILVIALAIIFVSFFMERLKKRYSVLRQAVGLIFKYFFRVSGCQILYTLYYRLVNFPFTAAY